MIDFEFRLVNPFSSRWNILHTSSRLIGKNKAVEANLYRTNSIFNIEFRFSIRGSHAGLRLIVGLLGFEGEFYFYDTRHWDYEKDTWCIDNC